MASSPSPSSTTTTRRGVSSAAASRDSPLLVEIKPLLDLLESSTPDTDILVRLQWLSLLKRVLVDLPGAKGMDYRVAVIVFCAYFCRYISNTEGIPMLIVDP
jgi:hypothetical protein